MAFVQRKYAIDTLRKNEVKFWKLFDGDSANLLGEMQDDGTEIDDSLQQLEDALNAISGGWVTVKANTKKAKQIGAGGDIKSGAYTYKISISDRTGNNQQQNNNGGGGSALMKELYEMRLKFELFQITTKHEAELAKLKDKKGDEDGLIGDIREILKLEYFRERGFTQAAIGSTDKKETINLSPVKDVVSEVTDGATQKDKIVKSIEQLAMIDGEIGDSLLKLAKFAKANPALYKKYLNSL